jgi:cytoskeletal protein CcmA (bactofilin family)
MLQIIVDGKIVGDIVVEKVTLRGHASVQGAITCKSLSMDPHVVVVGALNVHPAAPEKFAPTVAAEGESPVKVNGRAKNGSTAGTPIIIYNYSNDMR